MGGKLTLMYTKAANTWETQALPLGNGRLGAMVFGGVATDRIQFNEETLYSGKPSVIEDNAYKILPSIQSLLANKQYADAQALVDENFLKQAAYGTTSDFGAYQSFGNILVHLHEDDYATAYRRTLDLETAIANVEYEKSGAHYTRTYLASHPANLIAIHYAVSGGDARLSANIEICGTHANEQIICNASNELLLCGSLDNLDYQARLRVNCSDGQILRSEKSLTISDAHSFTLYLSAATDYMPSSPTFRGKDSDCFNRTVLDAFSDGTFDALQKEHCADYSALFSKNNLFIADDTDKSGRPTEERLTAYKNGEVDNALEVLLYQYGRYLLISSSRGNTLPANLQGIWNDSNNPEWGSIFCYNINFNMNYWCAEVTGLQECHLAAIHFIESLQKHGRKVAQAYFNARGWFTSKKSDIWGFTNPYAKSVYGLLIGGSGWLCQDVWEYYNFNREHRYLKEIAYPIMKSAAEFYLDYLTENEDGFLITSPASSPENSYLLEGRKLNICAGTEIDTRIIEELFTNCLRAAKILCFEDSFTTSVRSALAKLAPVQINKDNMIQEWYDDFTQAEPSHRHLSFAYGIHPSQVIDLQKTPAFAQAYAKTTLARGETQVGWSIAWKISIWARLQKASLAHQCIRSLITKRIASNLFTVEPPFQLDANAGLTAGIAETLLQSYYENTLWLLPALPEEWCSGHVTGLRARGNFTVDLRWQNHRLICAQICGESNASGTVIYKKMKRTFVISENGKTEISFVAEVSKDSK